MKDKPTRASVTTDLCECGYLQQAADDPDNPIVFEKETNEFHFTYRESSDDIPATLIIYHCPFCGGAAPPSKRDLLFAPIPREEHTRLTALLKPLKTIGDVLSTLGVPDHDSYSVTHYPSRDESAPGIIYNRELRYQGLSDVADVCIFECSDGEVRWTLQSKPRNQ
jgi:hypothetical protein